MTVSPGDALPAVFDRYRSDGFTLFEFDQFAGSGALSPTPVTDLPRGHFDELFDPAGRPRPAWTDLVSGYGARGDDRLRAAATRLAISVRDDGVIYNEVDGARTITRDWHIDPVPLIVDGDEWSELEQALAQRSTLLDLVLRDLYRDQKTIRSGLIPPEMVFGHPGYIRKAARLEVAGPHALFLHAVDVVRTGDGRFAAYSDRTQAPSGIGYAIIDRRLLSRTFPQLFQACAPRPMTNFAGTLRLALFDYAPPGVDDPTVAVLSPGSMSETAFDQAYLASVLGFPLVEGSDLTVRDGALYMRSLGRFKRVDVLLRRIDAQFTDPLDLRTDSRLGVAGLVEAISRGTVTVVNTLGSGVLENPALHTVLEKVAPMLIDEELAMPSVPAWWGGEDLQRGKMIADLGNLVLTNTTTGEELLGPLLDSASRFDLGARIEAQTWQWVGRAVEHYSVAPSMTEGIAPGRAVRAAPVAIRTFTVAQGPGYAVMPGGLGSVLADGADGAALRSIAAKDVWVTSAEVVGHVSRKSETRGEPDEVVSIVSDRPASRSYSDVAAAASPRVLADLYWLGRYGERTELVTRLAKVSRERYQDFQYRPWMTGTGAVPLVLHAVATVTGTSGHLGTAELLNRRMDQSPAPDQVTDAISKITELTVAADVAGTIAHSADRLVATVRAVRDQMSTSTWMVLTAVERAIHTLRRAVDDSWVGLDHSGGLTPDGVLDLGPNLARAHDEILHGVLALAGLQAESMVHDAGWQFMDLGRRIERTATVADLTRAMFVEVEEREVEQALLDAYLIANESSVIYRRRNRGLLQLSSVAELLFFDDTNPRSLIYQLDRMRERLAALPEELRSAVAERSVEEMAAEVRRSDPVDLAQADSSGRRVDLDQLMTTLGDGVRELSDVLTRTRFAQPSQAQPIWGAAGGDVAQ